MRVLSKSPLGWSAKLPSLKMWWWKVLLLQRFLHKKKIGSRILRERRAWTLFQQPKSRAMGLDLGSKWAKLQKKKKGIEEVFKYYSTTRHQHNTSMTKCSKNVWPVFFFFCIDSIVSLNSFWYIYITKNKINLLNLF